jgi:hypothetical protein
LSLVSLLQTSRKCSIPLNPLLQRTIRLAKKTPGCRKRPQGRSRSLLSGSDHARNTDSVSCWCSVRLCGGFTAVESGALVELTMAWKRRD